jgi:hypothetical protein
MNTKIEKILYALMQYYAVNRQVGHTTAMMEGVKNVDGKVIVLTQNLIYGNELKKLAPNVIPVSIDFLSESIVGRKNAMVLDNHAIQSITARALSEITDLRDDLANCKNIIKIKNDLIETQLKLIASLQKTSQPWYKRVFKRSKHKQEN